eukprot:5199190-Pleurochrysis_carterae.AAC.1
MIHASRNSQDDVLVIATRPAGCIVQSIEHQQLGHWGPQQCHLSNSGRLLSLLTLHSVVETYLRPCCSCTANQAKGCVAQRTALRGAGAGFK